MLTPTCSMRIVRSALLALLLATIGCAGGGEDVTPESLARARRLWERAGIRDYNLEWTNTGASTADYRVEVRGGRVRSVAMVQPDGRTIEAKPADPDFYGIDGLFTTIADELAQLQTPMPFGKPKGTKIILRFTPDAKLGYPRSYRRDVLGTPLALAIDVVRFVPDPPPSRSSPSP